MDHDNDRFASSGIREEAVDNFQEHKAIIPKLLCCVCLHIVKTPMECLRCDTLYCNNCLEIVRMAGKHCVSKCDTSAILKKANKFVREVLDRLTFTCNRCARTKITYDEYVIHVDICNVDKDLASRDKFIKEVMEKEAKIEILTRQIEEFKFSQITNLSKNELRSSLVTNVLNTTQKMELYNATIQGKVQEFTSLVEKKNYPILEEVSAKNYYWTCLHYSMHYGKLDLILYMLGTLKGKSLLDSAMRLESNDGRCPLICLLRSNILSPDEKKKILETIFTKFTFFVSAAVKKELKNKGLEYLQKRFKF